MMVLVEVLTILTVLMVDNMFRCVVQSGKLDMLYEGPLSAIERSFKTLEKCKTFPLKGRLTENKNNKATLVLIPSLIQ